MEILRAEGISKRFGGVDALNRVSFSVDMGEKLAILGPNGAGKTTLINVINGLLKANEGELYFSGKNITRVPTQERAHLGISRSFQVDTLFNRLTVLDNVLMSIHGIEKSYFQPFKYFHSYKKHQGQAETVLKRIGLHGKKNVLVGFLSHGEKKKLEIITSMVSSPKLLLLDEPNAGLTAEETSEIIVLIKEMAPKTTVIIVAHDMDMIFRVADQIMVLNYGKFVAKSAPETIKNNLKVKEIYLGS